MQKVVKDILQDTRKKIHDNVKFSADQIKTLQTHKSLGKDFVAMRDLIFYRETFEIRQLIDVLKKQVFEKERQFFNVWMSHTNEYVQNLA